MHIRANIVVASAIACFAIGCFGTAKADPSLPLATAAIANDAFETVPGSVHINQAAGNENVQGNVTDFSIGTPAAQTRFVQRTSTTVWTDGSASIHDLAFADVSGLVQINQTAGSGNAQGNIAIVRLAVPANVLSDDALAGAMPVQSASASGSEPSGLSSRADTAGTVFHGKGIVQLNQTAGNGNATANGFLLQVSATH